MDSGKFSKLDFKSLPDPGNKYKLGLKIGGGVGGEVFEAVEVDTGKKLAIKIIEVFKETEEEIKQEYAILKLFSENPSFPRFYGAYLKRSKEDVHKVWLVLEFCEGGTAIDFVRKHVQEGKKSSEIYIAYIMKEAIKAVIQLHEHDICHRDIRGSNILLTADGKIKLIDFGISKRTENNKKMRTCIGSPSWLAPELIVRHDEEGYLGYNKKVDVWGLGITAIELGDGVAPFEEMHPGRALFQIVQNPPPTLRKPAEWSQLYNDFISECLIKDPENRPHVQELLGHTFFEIASDVDNIQNDIQNIIESQKHVNLYKNPDVQVRKGYMKTEKQLKLEKILQEDLAALTEVSEDSVLSELYERFKKNQIYTFVGDILLFLNPNKRLDLYGTQVHKKYKFKAKSQNAPHIYSIAESAYREVFHHEKPQHIIFAGETGAGKTFNMMHAVDHLLFLGQGLKSTEKVNKALSVFQAIGNGATPYNANSTRHVLQTQLTFTETGKVTGGVFRIYQLEKERVTTTTKKQANFHIFYYFYDAIESGKKLNEYCLDTGEYKYLKAGLDSRSDKKSNVEAFNVFEGNLKDFGFDEDELDCIKCILASILLIGEIEFIDDEDGNALVTTTEIANNVASLLGVESKKLSWALVNYCVIMKGEAAMRQSSKEEAEEARNVLARALYTRLVDWLVNTINEKLSVHRVVYGDRHVISLLDYYGFECYRRNTLSQLFVNILNEQLQFHYNQKIFAWEKHTAEEEGITFPNLIFNDNKAVIDLIMSKPEGLLHKIDEATRNEDTEHIIGSLGEDRRSPIFAETSKAFSITHYTGKLTYDASDMKDKNKDFLPPELIGAMRFSTKEVTKQLFSSLLTKSGNLSNAKPDDTQDSKLLKVNKVNTNIPGQYSQSRQMRTAATIFRNTCVDLFKSIAMLDSGFHFVRCIKGDLSDKSDSFHPEVVRQQLRALQVVNTVLTTQQGYSNGIPHNEFIRRYKFLAFDFDENVEETKENCRLLMLRLKMEGWAMGKTKVFLKYYNKEYLSRLYETQIKKIVKVQSMMRAFVARRKLYAKVKRYQVDSDKIKKKNEDENNLMDTTQAATIIQKKFREFKQSKTDDLSAEQKAFIQPWVKRWKAKSIFQVLLLYRAERLQVLVNFSVQIHIFNQKALNLIKRQNLSVPIDEIDVTANSKEYLPPVQMTAFKLPFVREGFIQKGDVDSCEVLPICNLEALKTEIVKQLVANQNKNISPKIFKEEETQTSLHEVALASSNEEENVYTNENLPAEENLDEIIIDENSNDLNSKIEQSEYDIKNEMEKLNNDEQKEKSTEKDEDESEQEENRFVLVNEEPNNNQIISNNIDENLNENNIVDEQLKKEIPKIEKEQTSFKVSSIRPPSIKTQRNFTSSIKELEEKFQGSINSENKTPFDFRSMLRKTNYPIRYEQNKNENSVFEFEFREKKNGSSWNGPTKTWGPSDSIVTELAPGILIRGKIAEF